MSAREFGSECIVRSHLPLSDGGYPVLSVRDGRNTNVIATRLVYRLFIGKVEHWKVVSHRCGNKACINPAHLYLRSHSEAVVDKGERQRLSPEDRWYIRRSPRSLGQLDATFGYGKGGLSNIRRRKRGRDERFSMGYALLILWEHVTRKGRRR